MGEEMLSYSTARGARLREYWAHFDDLEAAGECAARARSPRRAARCLPASG